MYMFQSAHIGVGNCVNIEQQINKSNDLLLVFHMQCMSRLCKYCLRYMYVCGEQSFLFKGSEFCQSSIACLE